MSLNILVTERAPDSFTVYHSLRTLQSAINKARQYIKKGDVNGWIILHEKATSRTNERYLLGKSKGE